MSIGLAITAASLAAKFAPEIVGLFTDDETATKAADVVSKTAQAVTGTSDNEQALQALETDPKLQIEFRMKMAEHAAQMYRAETERLREVNKTMRVEATANDAYVRRWRPTFGYAVALAWTVQASAIAYAICFTPAYAGELMAGMTHLSVIWGVALSVLGINVAKRSHDKQVAAGLRPSGGLATLLQGVLGRNGDGGGAAPPPAPVDVKPLVR